MNDKHRLWRSCVHEAGHVVVALAIGHAVYKVSVVPVGNNLGRTIHESCTGTPERPDFVTFARSEIGCLFGGAAAEWELGITTNEELPDRGIADRQTIETLAEELTRRGEPPDLDHLWRGALFLVNKYRRAVETLALVLEDERTLDDPSHIQALVYPLMGRPLPDWQRRKYGQKEEPKEPRPRRERSRR